MINNQENQFAKIAQITSSKIQKLSTVYLSSIIQSERKTAFEEKNKYFKDKQSSTEKPSQDNNVSSNIITRTNSKQQSKLIEFNSKLNLISPQRIRFFTRGNSFFLSDIADSQYKTQRSQSHMISQRQKQVAKRKNYAMRKLEFKSFLEMQESKSMMVVANDREPKSIIYKKQLNSSYRDPISLKSVMKSYDRHTKYC